MSRIFDSSSSSWIRGFHEFPIILHVYGSSEWASVRVLLYMKLKAGNDLGSGIGIVLLFIVVLGRRILDGKPQGLTQRGTSLALWSKAALLLSLSKQRT